MHPHGQCMHFQGLNPRLLASHAGPLLHVAALLWMSVQHMLLFALTLWTDLSHLQTESLLYLFFSGFRSVNLQKISSYIPKSSCQAPARTDVILCCQLILMEALWPPICHTATKTWQADGKATFKSPWPNSRTGNTQSGTKHPILSELGSKRHHCTSPLARSQNIKWTGRYFKITP